MANGLMWPSELLIIPYQKSFARFNSINQRSFGAATDFNSL